MRRVHFLTSILIMSFVVMNIMATTSSSSLPSFESGKKCRAPIVQLLDDGNMFVKSSNELSRVTAATGFEGCWSYWAAGPCRAIYSQGQGYKICGQCDAYGNPGSGGCSSISAATLNRGYWCS